VYPLAEKAGEMVTSLEASASSVIAEYSARPLSEVLIRVPTSAEVGADEGVYVFASTAVTVSDNTLGN
jgi:hypothetical protein